MSEIKIACPHCGQHYEVGPDVVGKKAVCERCGKDFTAAPMIAPAAAAAVKPAPAPAKPEAAKPAPTPKKSPDITNCYACGGVIHIKARTCPHCGNPLRAGRTAGEIVTGIIQIALLFIGFPIAVSVAWSTGGPMSAVIAAIWAATFILCLK